MINTKLKLNTSRWALITSVILFGAALLLVFTQPTTDNLPQSTSPTTTTTSQQQVANKNKGKPVPGQDFNIMPPPSARNATTLKAAGVVMAASDVTWANVCDAYPNNATYTYMTLCDPGNKDTDDACPYWQDCDGDGHYWHPSMANLAGTTFDCDENCATCYKGSTETGSEPDGRDNDCDGVIDNE